MKEMFTIGPANAHSGFPPRIFPSTPETLESSLTDYYEKMNELASLILRVFALNLNLGENFFDKFTDHHASALRTVHYPEVSASTGLLPGQLRCSAHTDYGTITILRTDGPGLQVSKDLNPPQWHDVPFVPDSFIINLGDLMKRWTNDKWLSTLHRVVVMEGDFAAEADTQLTQDDFEETTKLLCRRRQSIAFFHNVNRDAQISVLLTDKGESPKYAPIIAGEFLLQKHLASLGIKKP